MVQFSIVAGGSLPVLESAVAGAARFAEAVRSAPNARAVSTHAGSATVTNDPQRVAASGRFTAEANARSAGALNASAATSLLQTADAALAEISTKLDRLETLAGAATSGDRSAVERAQFDTEFQSIKAEIDSIAETTAFNGTALLQGGSGPGGTLEISFKVGTGAEESDSIVVRIAPASVADLSSGLDGGLVQTQADAETALDDIETAQDAVNSIRAGIAGDAQRFFSSARGNRAIEKNLEETSAVLTNPTVAVDLAQLLATRIADDGGIRLTDRAVDQIQKLLISLSQPGAPSATQDSAPGSEREASEPISGGRETSSADE